MEGIEEEITIGEWEHIVHRNLAFQRYVFRKAWGVYYGLVASVMAVISYLSKPDVLGFAGVVIDLLIALALILITVLLFRRAYRTARLEQTMDAKQRVNRRRRLIGLWVFAFYAAIIITAIFLPNYILLITYATFLPLPLIILSGLKLTFRQRLPPESLWIMISYEFSAALSLVFAILAAVFGDNISPSLLWMSTVIIWFFASIYALLHARDELEGLVEE